MREPKRLAHRQAERNKARALKRWSWDENDDEAVTAVGGTLAYRDDLATESFLSSDVPVCYQA